MTSLWTIRNIVSPCMSAFSYLVRRKDGTVNRKVAEMFEQTLTANAKPVDGVATFDAVVDSATGVWARLFVPTQELGADVKSGKKMPVIFYYHGGGFAFMAPNVVMYDQYCRRLAKHSQAVVISVHYRLAPEHKFPVAYDDCYAALEWFKSAEAKALLPLNVDLARIFLAGDSAGGNIAHQLAVRAAGKDDLGPSKIRGLVSIQPFFGGEERTPAEIRFKSPSIVSVELGDWFWKAFLPGDATRDHPACNVFGPQSEDLSSVAIPRCL